MSDTLPKKTFEKSWSERTWFEKWVITVLGSTVLFGFLSWFTICLVIVFFDNKPSLISAYCKDTAREFFTRETLKKAFRAELDEEWKQGKNIYKWNTKPEEGFITLWAWGTYAYCAPKEPTQEEKIHKELQEIKQELQRRR